MENDTREEIQEIRPNRPSTSNLQGQLRSTWFETLPRPTAEFLNSEVPETDSSKVLRSLIDKEKEKLLKTPNNRILKAITSDRVKASIKKINTLEEQLEPHTVQRRNEQFDLHRALHRDNVPVDFISTAPRQGVSIDDTTQSPNSVRQVIERNTVPIDTHLAQMALRPLPSRPFDENSRSSSDEGCSATPKHRGNKL
ncbi:hypothetical protein FGM00_11210 [Aggregatimonas sangjinii]|uniref:Uncharacterized protein n=1 Tax=Aggregatimonas sangjinii TaxID=2583587 RepID=A0A5B7SPN7_9FLAO|nr:hypothetical protein [Aggregatimonas sangjinii]QCX00645.1 hypothetical protein FGM00_11210 [Aggregatimonas sangjinii]